MVHSAIVYKQQEGKGLVTGGLNGESSPAAMSPLSDKICQQKIVLNSSLYAHTHAGNQISGPAHTMNVHTQQLLRFQYSLPAVPLHRDADAA